MVAKPCRSCFVKLTCVFLVLQHVDFVQCKIIFDESQHVNVCLTPSCVKIAAYILDAINYSADPCEDFYEFACGKWLSENIIPDDKLEYSVNAVVEETVQKQMKMLLENSEKNPSKSIQMAKTFYKNCVNETKINEMQSQPLIQMLNDLGGWPIFQPNWADNGVVDVTELLGKIVGKYSGMIFVSLDVSANWTNTNLTMLHIDQGSLGLGTDSRDYYLNDTLYDNQMNAYRKLITDLVQLLAKDLNVSNAVLNLQDVEDVISFERNLANITVAAEERRNYTRMYNSWTISQLSSTLPYINWTRLFDIIFSDEINRMIRKPNFQFNVVETEFMSALQNLLAKTNKKTVLNYIFWRLVGNSVDDLDSRYQDAKQEFLKVFVGREKKPIRWQFCVDSTIEYLQLASGALYVRNRFTKDDKEETLSLVKRLFLAFKEMIKRLDWMDDKTKGAALRKADLMRNSIGYPDLVLKDASLDDYYKKLSFGEDISSFEIVRKIVTWYQQRSFDKLLKPYDKDEFEMSPATVNAYYSPEKNSINFPAAILSFPFFKSDFPKYINYGATGATIGHEITHGFDDEGSQYDEFGNLKNWWSPKSMEQFGRKSQCMIKQYDAFVAPGTETHISGQRTIGENVADNGGLKAAYKAYLNYVTEVGRDELRLPGLQNVTNEQMFFISYANSWCGKRRPASALQAALTDPHSPPMFRVNGVVVNSPEFSEVFKCKVNSKMNPDAKLQPKCSVW